MKQFAFFILGVVCTLLFVAGYVLFGDNPFCTQNDMSNPSVDTTSEETEVSATVHEDGSKTINFSDTQKEMLDTFGIDPDAVPTHISPQQEACFREVLGTTRVDEILSGDTPSALEVLKGKSRIESQ